MYLCCLQNKIFTAPTRNHPDKKHEKSPAKGSAKVSESKVDGKDDSSKWNILDSCCFSPYKVLFAPITKIAQVISQHTAK